jgi:RND family efflux transporter MFP subunit
MSRTVEIAVPVLIMSVGIAGAVFLMSMSSTPSESDAEAAPLAVEVVSVEKTSHEAVLHATGTVQAATQIDLIPQVAGRIDRVAPGLTPGARFDKGGLIAHIDGRDYAAQVTQAKSNVASAQLNLELERGRAAQAVREQELLGTSVDNALVRREPQLAAAKAGLEAAKAALRTAELNVARTSLVAPFNAVVTSETLDVGQYVAPGAGVARLIGTDRFRVRVSLPVQDLELLDVPPLNAEAGSRATVRQELGNGRHLTAEGFVLRALGELDAQTRTAAVLVAIDNPLDQGEGLPILPGAYVDVELLGRSVPDIVRVPRVAIDEGKVVWLADQDDRLAQRQVDIVWGDPDHVYVSAGLQQGDRVVVTPMALPILGMRLDVQDAVASNVGEEAP